VGISFHNCRPRLPPSKSPMLRPQLAPPVGMMASPHRPPPKTIRDLIAHGDFVEEEDEVTRRMSRLSMEAGSDDDGGDADDENDDGGGVYEDDDGVRSDVNGGATYRLLPAVPPPSASLPGTLDRGALAWSGKEYASETEARSGCARRHNRRREREARLERAWRVRKQGLQVVGGEASLGGGGGVAMDVGEVRACRDLGLDLPAGDWTVEVPGGVDTASSGGNSPASGSWRISSPGKQRN
jgi:hypothetical protein